MRLALPAALLCLLAAPAGAEVPGNASPGLQCRAAIRAAERAAGIPAQLMAAIGRVESGRREADGSVNPWPWSINAEGVDHVFESKAEAIAAVQALQARGVRSIDVGCMQVNLLHHPDAFATLEQAFDPVANATYAAHFLVDLHGQTGGWPAAAAMYHSATPELGADYERKVMAAWPMELQADPAGAWAAPRPGGTGLTPGGFAPSFARALPGPAAGGARVIPLAAGQSGRGLAAYRAMPIPLAAGALPPPLARRAMPGRG